MANNSNINEDKILADMQKAFEVKVLKADIELSPTHTKKEYTFSLDEKRRLAQMQAIVVFAQGEIEDIINGTVLPRLKILPTQQVRVLYEINVGRFTIWTPRSKD